MFENSLTTYLIMISIGFGPFIVLLVFIFNEFLINKFNLQDSLLNKIKDLIDGKRDKKGHTVMLVGILGVTGPLLSSFACMIYTLYLIIKYLI